MLIPDPGYVLVEGDLSGADAQVVAWDSGAPRLKAQLREGLDLHTSNARWIYGDSINPRALHSNGMSYRDNAKRAVHAGNYAAGAKTLGTSIGVPTARAEAFLRWWRTEEHPEIGRWHTKIETLLHSRRMPIITNAFGFRRLYTDMPDRLLGQALAWIAQSTVSLVIDHAMLAIDDSLPECQLLLQVHDSLLYQVPSDQWPALAPHVLKHMEVTVPYEDPLVIPVELKWSATDWGSMQKLTVH